MDDNLGCDRELFCGPFRPDDQGQVCPEQAGCHSWKTWFKGMSMLFVFQNGVVLVQNIKTTINGRLMGSGLN